MADSITLEVDGQARLRASLADLKRKLPDAMSRGLSGGADVVQRNAMEQLSLTTHPPGTPTPSEPGMPPSLVTGDLRRSVEIYGPYATGPNSAEIAIGPTAVQGRIQELGGITGKDYATRLPSRPYMVPAAQLSYGAVSSWFLREFTVALEG